MNSSKIDPLLQEWLSESEGFSLRAERLVETLDNLDPNYHSRLEALLPWLQAAFEIGQESMKTPMTKLEFPDKDR